MGGDCAIAEWKSWSGKLLNHDIVIILTLAVVILTLLGAGSPAFVGLVGVMLCAVGMMQRPAHTDLKVLLPLLFYNAISIASALAAGESAVKGYVSMQAILPVLYLLLACLDDKERLLLRRLCVLWAGGMAIVGILRFTALALAGGAGRLGWPLGNPNALGCFLVLGWFILIGCLEEPGWSWLVHLEPVILMALALTLSMESFLSMAVGMLTLILEQKRRAPWKEVLRYAWKLLARAALGVGTGILLFLAGDRTERPWMCLLVLVCGLWAVLCWRTLERFLEAYPWMAVLIAGTGVLVASAAVVMRPSSIATFIERLEMMADGLGYLGERPLLGVGPYRWRYLNLDSGDKYFNTWFIHNTLIHTGVEAGLLAAAALLFILFRFCRKQKTAAERGALAAFFTHNMLDVSWFSPGIAALFLLTAGEPRLGGRQMRSGLWRVLFGGYALYFVYTVYRYRVGM